MPKRASSAAMRMSQVIAIETPPPMQRPWIIASSGLPSLASDCEPAPEMRRYSSSSAALRRRSLNCEMSAPATKACSPAPRRITTRIASSAARSATYSGMACHISWLTALRFSGWLKVIQPIGPSFCISSFSVFTVAVMALSWDGGWPDPWPAETGVSRPPAPRKCGMLRAVTAMPTPPRYDEARAAFRWEESARALGWRPGEPVSLGHTIVDRHAGADRPALRWRSRHGEGRTYTFDELARLTARFAAVLQAHGVRRGDRVAS